MIVPNSYAWSSPYKGCWLEHYYSQHFYNLYGGKIATETQFQELLTRRCDKPELMIMSNFIVDRAAIVSLCREHGINMLHSEDGFFPHYETIHADPLGFCWESSLPRMIFRECSEQQRDRANQARDTWLNVQRFALPRSVTSPFVLWPLQLLEDKVNHWGLRLSDWRPIVRGFRECLPLDFQLVVKRHPLATPLPGGDLDWCAGLPNTIVISQDVHLADLLRECHAVAGVNSSVLYEARLMHRKPTYVYGRSWFTNHEELFLPMHRHIRSPLPRTEWLYKPSKMRQQRLDEYCDWFLAQLLVRQMPRPLASSNAYALKEFVTKLSYKTFAQFGASVFS